MGGDLVQQHDRWPPRYGRRKPRDPQHDRQQQRLLLTRRAVLRRHVLGPVPGEKVGAMGTETGAADFTIAGAPFRQTRRQHVFDLKRRAILQRCLNGAIQRQIGARKRSLAALKDTRQIGDEIPPRGGNGHTTAAICASSGLSQAGSLRPVRSSRKRSRIACS